MSTQIASILGFDAIVSHARRHPFDPPVKRFLFLRHGETDGNLAGHYQRIEQPLNATGLAQARAAAEALKAHRLGRVIGSPMDRAWVTARLAAEAQGVTPTPDGGLQERLFLPLVGTPVGHQDWSEDRPGCEPLATFVERTAQAMSRGLREAEEEPLTLLVAHGGVLLVLAALCGLDLAPEQRRNATPLLVSRVGEGWRAETVG